MPADANPPESVIVKPSPGNTPGKEVYWFGPFQVDADKEMLSRDGVPLPLTPKAFQILLVLLRGSGELVTKDQIMKAVWPDTFVEETNLTRNIFSIRKALGETPENQYIVTVSGKGYRVAERPQLAPQQQVQVVTATRSIVEMKVEEDRPRSWWLWGIGAAALVTLSAGLAYRALHRPAQLTEKDAVVLADFSNTTGDAVFEPTLTQGLTVQLEQSPFLHIVSDARVQHTLRLMGRRPTERFTPTVAREVCERIGATVVVEGSIASLGRDYVLGLRATYCGSGDLLDVEQASAASKEQVLDAVSQVASRFRRRVGESLRTQRMHDKPLEEATTTSLDALKAFSAGHRTTLTESMVAGISLQRRAVELDPNFALAWAHLALSYADSGQTGPAVDAAKQAYELRSRVSDREQFLIDVTYHRIVTGDLEKARQACATWAQAYPRDPLPPALMSGMILQGQGDFETSVEEAKKALALNPDLSPAYSNLAYSYFLEDRPKEASEVVEQNSARGFDPPEMILLRYYLAFLSGDADGMKRAAARAEGRPWAEDWMAQAEALAAADGGRIHVARELSRKAMELAVRSGQPDRAAGYQSAFAVNEALFGFPENATRQARVALKASRGRDVVYTSALAIGLAGDVNATAGLRKELEVRFPEDTVVSRIYVPVLNALIAMKKGHAKEAADALSSDMPGELAIVGDGSAMLGNVYSAYMRGEALLRSGHALEAVAEFQKLLDHPGVRFTDPICSFAYLGIAQAYHRIGDRSKERLAYETFLQRWQLADQDVPILKAARTEYRTFQ